MEKIDDTKEKKVFFVAWKNFNLQFFICLPSSSSKVKQMLKKKKSVFKTQTIL
jgi:hypothetical protein